MEIINVHEAKTHLSRLLQRVEQGEEIVIGRAGTPAAKLVPYRPSRGQRQGGQWKGRVWMANDFDETPPEVVAAFSGAGEEGP